jgi:hypothetical protein
MWEPISDESCSLSRPLLPTSLHTKESSTMPTQLITVPVMFQSLTAFMSDGDRQDGEIDLGV